MPAVGAQGSMETPQRKPAFSAEFVMNAKLLYLIQAKFSNEIWLIIGDYEYIYITGITIEECLLLWDFRGKTIFRQLPPPKKKC